MTTYLIIGLVAACWATRYAVVHSDAERGFAFVLSWLLWPMAVVLVIVADDMAPSFNPFTYVGWLHRRLFEENW